MGKVIAFRQQDKKRKEANFGPMDHDSRWICNEQKYVRNLKKSVDLYGFSRDEKKYDDIYDMIAEGLSQNFNLSMNVKLGMEDSDVEFELLQDSDGSYYYAVYTDSTQALRSRKSNYYDKQFKLPLYFLIGNIKDEDFNNGICINPFSGTPVIVTKQELQDIYGRVCG